MRMENNVTQQYDFIVARHLSEGSLQVNRRILLISGTIFPPRPANTDGRIEQAFACRIITRPAKQSAYRFLNVVRH